MGRREPVIEDGTVDRIRDAALRCICRHGYDGSSIREVARSASVNVCVLHQYFPAKEDLLYELIDATHDAAVAQIEASVAIAGNSPTARLSAAVWAHCDYHMRFQRESFVANTELRSLDPVRRARIVAKRDHVGRVFRDILVDGVEQGEFDIADPAAVSRAILSMCMGIASWYDPAGPEMPRQIAGRYCELAARLAGASGATATVGAPLIAAH